MKDDFISRKKAQEAILNSKAIMFVPDKEIAAEALNGVPVVADTVEVVRCKECKYCRDIKDNQIAMCSILDCGMYKDGFCYFGERRG